MVRHRHSGSSILLVFAAAVLSLLAGAAIAVETTAPRAMVVESDTDSVLYEKNTDQSFPPANFTKLMAAAVVFEALKSGTISEGTVYKVTEHAWRTGGAPARVTTMFAKVNSTIAVGDLVRGLVVHYANDAAIALAEGLAGSEDAFTERMNALAGRLGMVRTRFANPTGFPDPRARTTLADLWKLVRYLQSEHADHYALYGQREFEWNKILQTNKTAFVKDLAGADGLMMAFDDKAGFGAIVSVLRDGRRMLVAGSGFKSSADRDKEIRRMVDAAFAEFTTVTLYPKDAVVGEVRVFGGTATRVSVTGEGPVAVTLPIGDRKDFRARLVYEGPVQAPIRKGQRIAALEVRVDERLYQSRPLVAAEDVPVGDLSERARDGLVEVLFGWW